MYQQCQKILKVCVIKFLQHRLLFNINDLLIFKFTINSKFFNQRQILFDAPILLLVSVCWFHESFGFKRLWTVCYSEWLRLSEKFIAYWACHFARTVKPERRENLSILDQLRIFYYLWWKLKQEVIKIGAS